MVLFILVWEKRVIYLAELGELHQKQVGNRDNGTENS